MITEDERFIKIQGILAFSDIHSSDCIKINDLIIELSKENQQLKAELELHKGTLKREHEAIHRANDLENRIEKAIEYKKNIDMYEETLNDGTTVYMVQDVDVDEIERILKGEENK